MMPDWKTLDRKIERPAGDGVAWRQSGRCRASCGRAGGNLSLRRLLKPRMSGGARAYVASTGRAMGCEFSEWQNEQ